MEIQGPKVNPGEGPMERAGPGSMNGAGPLPVITEPIPHEGCKHKVRKAESYRKGLGMRANLYAGKGGD